MRQLKMAVGAVAALAFCACSGGASDASADANAGASVDLERNPDPGAKAESVAAAASSGADGAGAVAKVVFNGVALDEETLNQFAQFYGAIPEGDYWYDPVSGLVGLVGGPSSGQILPNLPLGGPLQASASGGGDGGMTAVFINGREIHPQEYMTLAALFGTVNPGRYWLWPTMIGGYEGGPAMFDLRAAAAQAAAGGGAAIYGDGGYAGGGAADATGEPGYNTSTAFGDLMSDGQCSGYFDPSSGASVMTGNC